VGAAISEEGSIGLPVSASSSMPAFLRTFSLAKIDMPSRTATARASEGRQWISVSFLFTMISSLG